MVSFFISACQNCEPEKEWTQNHDHAATSLLLHDLCGTSTVSEEVAIELLKLLMGKDSDSVRRVDEEGNLLIHLAASHKSPEF